jgi:c-di-GMP-related signal transduction protein
MSRKKFFLGRQPILNRDGKIIAYELLFRSAGSDFADISDDAMASSDVMFNALSTFGIRELLGDRKGFINFSYETLMTNFIELLPGEQIVIELMETILVDDEVIARCRELKGRGFMLALDNHVYDPSFEPLYEMVDIVKIDMLATPGHELQAVIKKLKTWPLTLLAEKVETAEQYDQCRDLGFDLFQGFYFARPIILAHKQIDMSKIVLVKLLKQLSGKADIMEIEEVFKLDPGLTYNLLRLVNSVALGLRVKISSLRHAIMILGTHQIKIWVLLAMLISRESADEYDPLLELAVMRGRLMELLIQRVPFQGETNTNDCAFLTGALSILHVILEEPMEALVEQLSLNEKMREALLARRGTLGELLLLAETAEQGDCLNIFSNLERLGLTFDHVSTAQVEAIKWSNTLLVAV